MLLKSAWERELAGGKSHGHSIIFRTSVLELTESGSVDLTPHENYGTRSVEYALFTHKPSGTQIDAFNTHFCVCSYVGKKSRKNLRLYLKTFSKSIS